MALYTYFFLLLFYQDPIVCVMELLFPLAELTKKQKDQDVLSAHAAGTKDVYRCLAASEFMFTNIKKNFYFTFMVDFWIVKKSQLSSLFLTLFALLCQSSQALPCTDTDPEIFQRRGRGGGRRKWSRVETFWENCVYINFIKVHQCTTKKIIIQRYFLCFFKFKEDSYPFKPPPTPFGPANGIWSLHLVCQMKWLRLRHRDGVINRQNVEDLAK